MRTAEILRETKETKIKISLNLDSKKNSSINTPIPFLSHMLEACMFYAGVSLELEASGDMLVDDHHTAEDIGIVLGQAIKEALSNTCNINRFGSSYVPMDESLSRVVLDISNRPYLVYDVKLKNERIGNFTLDNTLEFFRAFVNESRITLHITNLYGQNDHHILESIFKAFGKALKQAILETTTLQSTKGVL
jgi:imidazoleglycerol-phosphate dehydratase